MALCSKDILVGVEEKQNDNAKAQLKVAGILSIGGGIADQNINQNHNRIKFTIPVAFSAVKTPLEYKAKTFSTKNIG